MAVAVAELAGVAFLVLFYLWLLSLVLKSFASLLRILYLWLCDETVRDRLTASGIGRAFYAAFFPFGDVAVASATDDYVRKIDGASVALGRLLLDESRRLCKWKSAAIRALEKKATMQLAVAGVILAVLATLGRNDLTSAYRAIPVAALVVAIAAYMKASYIRVRALPSFGEHLTDDGVVEPLNEGRFAALAAGTWHEYDLDLEVVNKTKMRYVKTGNIWFIAALLITLLLVIAPGSSNATPPGAFGTPAPNDLFRNPHV